MRFFDVPGIGTRASIIGFGCSSLGSRIGPRRSLRALLHAHECGVTWFDVAPSYGNGLAEELLSEFIATRRHEVQICTKVGILPRNLHPLALAVRPIMRLAVRAAPSVRRTISRNLATTETVQITGSFIRQSLNKSLQRLKTDRVEVLALHEPNVKDMHREDVLRTLEDILRSGDALKIGIAGSLESASAAVIAGGAISVIQLANNPFRKDATQCMNQFIQKRGLTYITHSVFSGSNALQRLRILLKNDAQARNQLAAAGYREDVDRAAANALMDYALAANPRGIVLISMFQNAHLRENLERATRGPKKEIIPLLEGLVAYS